MAIAMKFLGTRYTGSCLSKILFNLYNHKNEYKKMIADDQKADASYSKRSGLLQFPG